MAKDCALHSGQHNEFRRSALDRLMRELPDSQSGDGRHKCPYCGYERGRQDGLKEGYRRAMEVLALNE